MWLPDPTLFIRNDLKTCDITNKTEMCCLKDVLDNMSQRGPTCYCPLPCTSVSYNAKLSRSLLPTQRMLKRMNGEFGENNDYIRVNVFYSSSEVLVYQQRGQWTITEALSFLGNEFGLWLGLSLMVVFEVLEKLAQFFKSTLTMLLRC
ncbi:degenerin mec-4 [Caerostris extrusa]|uniref:Degenerin mec-4 n=1 Tax=Caerostris extrusa TaxID=172846 RepID=A0AAV4MUU4_CAEEX|nr:degenerin mec-4 [Caerostris extrusa]